MDTAELKIERVTRRVVAPTVYRFPELPDHGKFKLRNWGWYSMWDLDPIPTEILFKQGAQHNPLPDYGSFKPKYFPQHLSSPFVWLIYEEGRPGFATVQMHPDPEKCPFSADNLYVPAGWAQIILRLMNEGVIGMKLNGDVPYGVRWNGVNLSLQTLHTFL